MTIKVLMYPHVGQTQPLPTNGISRVVKEYFDHLPNYGIEMLPEGADDKADLIAIHAGARSVNGLPTGVPMIACCHGLYWTQDHPNMGAWTHEMNSAVIDIVRHANAVAVPSKWIQGVFERDMHFSPAIVDHGVNFDEWQDGIEDLGYVLWNKNRNSDACDPRPVNELAMRAPQVRFLTTYASANPRPNIKITGTVPFEGMKQMILNSSVYLASTQETGQIGVLEAMAAGKPILAFNWGATPDVVIHARTGYLAEPNNFDDLAQGLSYCMEHRVALGQNAREAARHHTWQKAAEKVAAVFRETVRAYRDQYDRTMRIDPALYQRSVI